MKRRNLCNRAHLKYFNKARPKSIIVLILILCSSFYISCSNPLKPVDTVEAEQVKSELQDRSFRQFAPSLGATKRKGVILDFFDNENQRISLWAQYAEGNTALNEWEIVAKDYRVEKSGKEYRLFFESPTSYQTLPNKCDNCIEIEGISISIRSLYDSDKIEFRINDPDDILPIPFPVFNTWTRFREDEYFD